MRVYLMSCVNTKKPNNDSQIAPMFQNDVPRCEDPDHWFISHGPKMDVQNQTTQTSGLNSYLGSRRCREFLDRLQSRAVSYAGSLHLIVRTSGCVVPAFVSRVLISLLLSFCWGGVYNTPALSLIVRVIQAVSPGYWFIFWG